MRPIRELLSVNAGLARTLMVCMLALVVFGAGVAAPVEAKAKHGKLGGSRDVVANAATNLTTGTGGADADYVIPISGTYTSPEIEILPASVGSAISLNGQVASSTAAISATFLYSITSGGEKTWTDQTSGSYTTSLSFTSAGTSSTYWGTPVKLMPARFVKVVITNNSGVAFTLHKGRLACY